MRLLGRLLKSSPESTTLDGPLDAGLAWLCAMQPSFGIFAERDALPAGGSGLPWRIKPLGELIFLLIIFRRNGRTSASLDRLWAFAVEQARSFDWHMLAANDPSAASPVATIDHFFEEQRSDAPVEREYLQTLISINYFDGMDRLAYRNMDLIHGFSKIGQPEGIRELIENFGNTAFGRRQLIARYTIDDIYSLTHALFYLSDLGHRDVRTVLDAAEFNRLRTTLLALTAVMMRADNFDVLGELLICWKFCQLAPSAQELALFRAGMGAGLRMQGRHGSFASTAAQRSLPDENPSSFLALYHTTLVAVILLSLAGNWM